MSLGFRKSFGSTPSGTVSGGAVAQMVTVGIVDAHLTGGKADYSFFRSRMKTHNNFACETMSESFMGNVNWGQECSVTLNKTPDLVTNVFAVIDRPGIYAVRNNSTGSSGSSGWQRSRGSRSGSRPGSVSSRYKRGVGAAKPVPPGRLFPVNPEAGRTSSQVRNSTSREPRRTSRSARSAQEEPAAVSADLFWSEDDEEDEDSDFDVGPDDPAAIPEVYAHWVNSLGHAAIARTSISLAGMMGQMLTGRYIAAWAELTGTCGKEQDTLIGTYGTLKELIDASAKDERLYVQIPFSFTRFTGRALALVSMRFHAAAVSLALMPLNKLIKVSHPDVEVRKTGDGQPITKADVEAHLDVTAVFLDLEERKRFAKAAMSMLWEQVQCHEATYRGATIRAPLNFSHPSRCLIFMVQRKWHEDQNNTFEYGCEDPDEDPVQFAKLIVNTTVRFAREGAYFRKIVPFERADRMLGRRRYIYLMAFGLSISSQHTDGTLNFSRNDNCTLNLELHPSLADEPVTLYVYDFSVNVVTYQRGMVSVDYQ